MAESTDRRKRHEVCPCCGGKLTQPLTRDEMPLYFTGVQGRIYDLVRKANKNGLTANQLTERVYTDGGPLFAYRCILGSIYCINRKLKKLGMEIRKAGRAGPYYLVET